MTREQLHIEEMINEFRRMLPAGCSTAHAIDHRESWEAIATRAVDDGYIDFAGQLGDFIEACLRKVS